jgi:hypothetical protein
VVTVFNRYMAQLTDPFIDDVLGQKVLLALDALLEEEPAVELHPGWGMAAPHEAKEVILRTHPCGDPV